MGAQFFLANQDEAGRRAKALGGGWEVNEP